MSRRVEMRAEFKTFLLRKGYKEYTSSGNPSTVHDYVKRIDKVCEWESISWEELGKNITCFIQEYDIGGLKEEKGNVSHRAVINALKRFREYLVEEQ